MTLMKLPPKDVYCIVKFVEMISRPGYSVQNISKQKSCNFPFILVGQPFLFAFVVPPMNALDNFCDFTHWKIFGQLCVPTPCDRIFNLRSFNFQYCHNDFVKQILYIVMQICVLLQFFVVFIVFFCPTTEIPFQDSKPTSTQCLTTTTKLILKFFEFHCI